MYVLRIQHNFISLFANIKMDQIWGKSITAPRPTLGHGMGLAPSMRHHDARSVSSFNPLGADGYNPYHYNDSRSILIKSEATGSSSDLGDTMIHLDLDIEDTEALKPAARPFILTQSVIISLSFMLILITSAGSIQQVLVQVHLLGTYDRLAMLVMTPLSFAFCLFFFTIIINSVFQVLGPIKDIRSGNSRFYSSVKPDVKKHPNIEWPHITIQMPVYKEGLKGVIQPTVNSLLPAIAYYERMGGTASIFVADDGMQVVQPELADLRRKFYQAHGIGWVARPPHGKDGFIRGGRFKKASNLNYALDITLRVEDKLLQLIDARKQDSHVEELSAEDENELYEHALRSVLDGDQGRSWADGNIRMGEIILLIDSDTRVVSSYSHKHFVVEHR
jgi:hypothetical protein